MGCAVLGVGIFALVDGQALMDLINSANEALDKDINLNIFTSAAIILIAVAVFVVIVAFFGCCGAIKESKCMLGTYFAIILVMFIILIVGAVIGYTQSIDTIKNGIEESMPKYDPSAKEDSDPTKVAITKAWDKVQEDVSHIISIYKVAK